MGGEINNNSVIPLKELRRVTGMNYAKSKARNNRLNFAPCYLLSALCLPLQLTRTSHSLMGGTLSRTTVASLYLPFTANIPLSFIALQQKP
jgi:hypothetical protein